MTKKTMTQQIKERMKTATKIEAMTLIRFFENNSNTRNKKRSYQNERYALKVEKLGEKKWGSNWWKR